MQQESPPNILVVDDEAFVREAIELYLLTEGFEVCSASGGKAALELLEEQTVDTALLDIAMPGMDGIELLGEIKQRFPDVEVVMATGCTTLETAVRAMRMGAYDYITKPILDFENDLLRIVRRAVERRRLLTTNRTLAENVQLINRELRDSNAELKRSLATFEILYESGRLIGELESPDAVLDYLRSTLEYQLGLQRALFVVPGDDSLLVAAALGFGDLTSVHHGIEESVFADHLEDTEPWLLGGGAFRQLREAVVAAPEEGENCARIIPLRYRSRTSGLLIVFDAIGDDQLQLLKVLSNLVAAPLAGFGEQVRG